MTVRIGINGFGRIGRCVLAHIVSSGRKDVEVVKINATGPLETSAHLMRYDSVHGRFDGEITVGDGTLDLGLGPIEMFSSYDPNTLDWSGVDVVLECTGNFNDGDKAKVHLARGAKKVLISAPAVNVDRTIVLGANEAALLPNDVMISNGSCTTNCLAPLAKALNDAIGIERGIMTTIHSYTGDQPTLDRRHSDLYRARAAAMALIPTSTGRPRRLARSCRKWQGGWTGRPFASLLPMFLALISLLRLRARSQKRKSTRRSSGPPRAKWQAFWGMTLRLKFRLISITRPSLRFLPPIKPKWLAGQRSAYYHGMIMNGAFPCAWLIWPPKWGSSSNFGDTMTPRLALYVAIAAVAAIAADLFLTQGAAILYLARSFLDLIDPIAFWR